MRTKGFSLLEFLMVVGVISILLGLLLPGLTAVSRLSQRVAARHETRMLAAAWVEYFNTYQRWPTNSIRSDDRLDAALADILQGAQSEDNEKQLSFIDFSRFNAGGDPVNPFSRARPDERYYYVRFDLSGDNQIELPGGSGNRLARAVIVWTVNPDTRDANDPGYYIGSWQE